MHRDYSSREILLCHNNLISLLKHSYLYAQLFFLSVYHFLLLDHILDKVVRDYDSLGDFRLASRVDIREVLLIISLIIFNLMNRLIKINKHHGLRDSLMIVLVLSMIGFLRFDFGSGNLAVLFKILNWVSSLIMSLLLISLAISLLLLLLLKLISGNSLLFPLLEDLILMTQLPWDILAFHQISFS